ncbi:A-kinase anchor protein 7 isoforms alpha and beta [Geranomyces michiganensis]|nr:A-kinase anchor protein 7 isoforms alpha and beta [Geranomyces michiganensis]
MNRPRVQVKARPRAKAQQPNYFLSLRLRGEELEKNFRAFYEQTAERYPTLRPFLISPATGRAPDIHLKGASTFGNRVVYATPSPLRDLETLNNLREALQTRFKADGINLVGNRPQWTPHCTLMKTRFAPGNGGASIPAESWFDYKDFEWGSSSIAEIELCSMRDEKEPDGYYHCVAHVPFAPD